MTLSCWEMADAVTTALAEVLGASQVGTAGESGHAFTVALYEGKPYVIDAWPDGLCQVWPWGEIPASAEPAAYQVDPEVWPELV